ncbi:hypothetical protein BT96DRAFT_1003723 [Gymnopus androsaceus JB14]|uniref:Uncharacterized protein n=1 Tax=Gymnopus androsaceus JB14 TaxID=1447944 RepID=A0A6A4GT39_9AGAR|nr:hypothetical protein BT96DRAFT_1003723 [Gymnopus androsaceus JB14]
MDMQWDCHYRYPLQVSAFSIQKWLFDITARHIGAVDSILQGVMEQKTRLHEVSLNTFLGEANPRETLALESLSHAQNAYASAYL